jgi:hypothetical protein
LRGPLHRAPSSTESCYDSFVTKNKNDEALREVQMIDGVMVPVLALAVLAAMWIIVIYGSTFFGPKTD